MTDRIQLDEHMPALAAKGVYSREARRKLLAIRSRLTSVDAKLSNAVATGLLNRSTQLEQARHSVEKHLARVEQRLDALRKSGLEDWLDDRDAVDHAWEDLMRSIRQLLAHLSHESGGRS